MAASVTHTHATAMGVEPSHHKMQTFDVVASFRYRIDVFHIARGPCQRNINARLFRTRGKHCMCATRTNPLPAQILKDIYECMSAQPERNMTQSQSLTRRCRGFQAPQRQIHAHLPERCTFCPHNRRRRGARDRREEPRNAIHPHDPTCAVTACHLQTAGTVVKAQAEREIKPPPPPSLTQSTASDISRHLHESASKLP